jgi:hypothetical protein
MRYHEVNEQVVDEAPMNPRAFAKSIEAGQNKGVQVGFEFEVCIPSNSVKQWKNEPQAPEPNRFNPADDSWIEGKTISDLWAGFTRYGRRGIRENIEDLFKNKAATARVVGGSNVWTVYGKWVEDQVKEFQRTQKSTVIKKMKELFKNPVLKEKFTDHSGRHDNSAEDQRTLKDVALEELKEKTGLDFSGKISAAELKQALPGIREAMSRMYYRTHGPVDRLFMNVAEADIDAVNQFRSTIQSPGRYGDPAAVEQHAQVFSRFCNEVYGTDNLKELLKTKWAFRGRTNNATPVLKEKLWYFVTPEAEAPESLQPRYRYRDDTPYKDGADFLKANLKDSFGDNMVIFTGYHQDTKKLDRWYIEPDGSLRPSSGDYSAEVVSPPLKAKDAMFALKKFYEHAAGMKLYTNDSTGLHINVSIPDTLDVLKLALFVGDQHVLKTFGRENNRYANSILQSLKGRADRVSGTPDEMKDELADIAQRLSGDHFATVNFNGKYVSFRHAGGDYLSKLGEITNTVGRFIHAMIIASDPNMYRDEYIKKVISLVDKTKKPTNNDPRMDIRTNGIPAISMDFVLFKDDNGQVENARNSVAAWLTNNVDAQFYLVPSDGSAERLMRANGLSASTRQAISDAGEAGCVRAIVYPTNSRELDTVRHVISRDNGSPGVVGSPFGVYDGGTRYNSGRPKVAVGAMMPIKLSRKDKAFAQAYRGIAGGGETSRLPLPESDE